MPKGNLTLTAEFVELLNLEQILAGLSDNKGNFTAIGDAAIFGDDTSFYRDVELKYEVNNNFSSMSQKNTGIYDDESEVWFNQCFFDLTHDTLDVYFRTRDIDTVWTTAEKDTLEDEVLLNAFLYSANFTLLDSTMVTEENNNYILSNALTLEPEWDGWLDRLNSMTIIPKVNGASFVFEVGGIVWGYGDEMEATATFNFEVVFGNSNLVMPSWAQ